LHAIIFRKSNYLKNWLSISPKNAITVLDTHDGIGVIDVGASEGQPGLLPEIDIHNLVEAIHKNSHGQSRQATGDAASNLDLYQVNCTYFDALGKNEDQYLLARALQFFAPGIPQIYYMGLLAEPNDMNLLSETKVGRDINRHYFKEGEFDEAIRRPVVQNLIALIAFRNTHPAFNGEFNLIPNKNNRLEIIWKNKENWAKLSVDFETLSFRITYNDEKDSLELVF
jgi:sucrose phosphorylase